MRRGRRGQHVRGASARPRDGGERRETPASVVLHITGDENLDGGIDWLTLYFRDTRYTVTSTDVRVETQLTASVARGRYET